MTGPLDPRGPPRGSGAQYCRVKLHGHDIRRPCPGRAEVRITVHFRLPPATRKLVFQTLELTQDLLARRSVTPADEGCQEVLSKRLSAAGFSVEALRYGNVENLWARRGGADPVFCFAGHTDVVPSGP